MHGTGEPVAVAGANRLFDQLSDCLFLLTEALVTRAVRIPTDRPTGDRPKRDATLLSPVREY